MHEAATPALALILTGVFLGFGVAGFAAWLTESDWGTGLLAVLGGLAPLVWIFIRPSIIREAAAEQGGIALTGDEITFFVSLTIGLVAGILMIRAADRSGYQALSQS